MDSGDVIVALVIAAALSFDFTNGFHDTANAMATTIATGALIGAICWNLTTWWFGLPSSSSHALIGGIIGATIAAVGTGAVDFDGIVSNVIVPAIASPIVAGLVAAGGVWLVYRMIRRYSPERSEREFRWGQVASSSMVALAHGTNDAQKTMGVICLALIANGSLKGGDGFDVPTWVVVSCATAIALGTYVGGWRIIRTMGSRIIKMDPAVVVIVAVLLAGLVLLARRGGSAPVPAAES